MKQTTDFGFEQVPLDEKQDKVNAVFSSVASKYDLMNDLMSSGLHRIWKRQAIRLLRLNQEHTVLDLAGGTGDLTHLILNHPQAPKTCVLADINWEMLDAGRKKLLDKGTYQMQCAHLDATQLSFADASFDRVIIGFGLRNVAVKEDALAEIHRVLKPGGMLLVLEFSKIKGPLKPFYDLYSFKVLPKLGALVAKDSDSYRYLAESIRKHPCQESLKQMILEAGFGTCEYYNLSQGMVAIHRAVKKSDETS